MNHKSMNTRVSQVPLTKDFQQWRGRGEGGDPLGALKSISRACSLSLDWSTNQWSERGEEMRAFLLLGFLARWGKEELHNSVLFVWLKPKGRGGTAFSPDASQPRCGLAQWLQSQRVEPGSSSQSQLMRGLTPPTAGTATSRAHPRSFLRSCLLLWTNGVDAWFPFSF
jgi:hypothetical protein